MNPIPGRNALEAGYPIQIEPQIEQNCCTKFFNSLWDEIVAIITFIKSFFHFVNPAPLVEINPVPQNIVLPHSRDEIFQNLFDLPFDSSDGIGVGLVCEAIAAGIIQFERAHETRLINAELVDQNTIRCSYQNGNNEPQRQIYSAVTGDLIE